MSLIPNFSPCLVFEHALGVVLSQREIMCVFLICTGFLAQRSLPIPGSWAAKELLLAHRMYSPLVRAGLVRSWPPSLGNPADTLPRMLGLPVTGYLQLGFIGAGLLQACTAYVPWHAIHPPFPVSGRFFDIWRLPVLLVESPSWFPPSCMFLLLFYVLFHGCILFIWNQGFCTQFQWVISSSFVCS